MKNLNTIIVFASLCLLTFQCSKKQEENKSPTSVELIYPSQNLLCIDNNIPFNWSDATDPENDAITYNIIIANDRGLTDIVENRTISASQVSINLERATAYYWTVSALDVNNNQGTKSEVFAFYTKGEGTLNSVPFTSELLTPSNNSQVSAGSVNLMWDAADANTGDTLTYEILFGENSSLKVLDETLVDKSYSVTVVSGKTYSWQVHVKDQNGAKSIGQIWSFSVN